MTELQAELLLRQAARIEVLEADIEALKAALEKVLLASNEADAIRLVRAALAPEQDK